MNANELKPRRSTFGRDTLRELMRGGDGRDLARPARPQRAVEPRADRALPSIVQLAFGDPLPSDYYLG